MPSLDETSLFGMHENANFAYLKKESNNIFDILLSLQPSIQTNSSSLQSKDSIVLEIANKILIILPKFLNKEEANKNLFKLNEKTQTIPSLTTVLLQEITKYNKLLEIVKKTVNNLIDTIKGLILTSNELDEMYFAFINNQIPKNWKNSSYPSLKPLGSWIEDLCKRIEFMKNWLLNDNPPSFWLSGFFYHQGFITGILQTHSRKYKIPIDCLSFKFKVLELNKEKVINPPKVIFLNFFLRKIS